MIAEIISIGDELTSGQWLDTNSQWLSTQLGELGVQVVYHTTVADDLEANVAVFRQAIARADFIVASGGLGPTADDLTREALARAVGVELVLDQASLDHIGQLFARHKREMPERNRLQAMFPAGGRPIFNSRGTAPGIWLETPRPGGGVARVFALPGVPAEMFEMFAQTVAPAIAAASGSRRVIRHRRIKCFGAGESHVEQLLPDLIRRGREPSVGITVHAATITLRVTAAGATADECHAAMQPTLDAIHSSLGNLVFGEEDDELENVVVRLLAQRGQTLSTVESGTGGLLANWLSEADDGQGRYMGGIVLPNARAIPGWLADTGIGDAGASAIAAASATLARERFGADYALAIGEFPRIENAWNDPSPLKLEQESSAEYFFALASAGCGMVKASTLASHPSIWKPRAAKQVLNLLRLALVEGV